MAATVNYEERNAEMCRLYASGECTVVQCSQKFGITQERVRQILRQANVFKRQRPPRKRDQFLGVNLPQPLKDAVRAEAEEQGKTMSSLVDETLTEALKDHD